MTNIKNNLLPDEEKWNYLAEESKSVIYDNRNNEDICLYFSEENKLFLLKLLNQFGNDR